MAISTTVSMIVKRFSHKPSIFCMYFPYTSSVIGRIQRECHSVLAKLHPITFYRIISGECAVPGLNATFCLLWFTNCVLLFDKILILGCL